MKRIHMESRAGNRGRKMFPARAHRALDVGALQDLFNALLAGIELRRFRRQSRR